MRSVFAAIAVLIFSLPSARAVGVQAEGTPAVSDGDSRSQIPQAPTPRLHDWKKKPRRIFDAETSFELAAVAASLSADAVSTERFLGLQCLPGMTGCLRETNPLVRLVARNRPGTALYFGGAFALDAGATAWLRRHGHARIARVLNHEVAALEVSRAEANYSNVNFFLTRRFLAEMPQQKGR
jgi:hypothetical protein